MNKMSMYDNTVHVFRSDKCQLYFYNTNRVQLLLTDVKIWVKWLIFPPFQYSLLVVDFKESLIGLTGLSSTAICLYIL